MKLMRLSLCLFISLCLVALAQAQAPASPAYRVIVNAHVSVSSASRDFISDAFLKRVTRWPDGEVIRPVDLGGDSAARRKFSEDILTRSVAAVRMYWQQQIFSGRDVPPPELDGDAAVIKYVQQHSGAVGYVSGSSDISAVKVLTVK